MPRVIHLFAVCWLIWAGTFVLFAQTDVSPQFLTLDTPTRFELDGISPQFFYYDGASGEIITISMTRLSNFDDPLNNPVLEIWDVNGKRIAYNDNLSTDNPDAELHDIRLLQDGYYIIRADTYGGVYAGEFEIVIRPSDPFQQTEIENGVEFYLPANTIFEYVMPFDAGDVVTISAQDLSFSLDPLLWITNSDGDILAKNDDHTTAGWTLYVLDSQIYQLTIPETGEYTIYVRDFLGRSGRIGLTIVED
ncbi:MAG: hypothetical protein KJ043_17355 [Anaerolineae bacterium]|nr:hypothetical protein [Anaerolineae bacterium]